MRPMFFLCLCSSVLACASTESPGDCIDETSCTPDVVVLALDEGGESVSADAVYWYFSPDEGAYDGDHPLDCADNECSEWTLPTAPAASFYVAGHRGGPEHLDPYCGYSGYDGKPVDFDGDPVTIELDLSLHELCQ